jgi:hypothetical protein
LKLWLVRIPAGWADLNLKWPCLDCLDAQLLELITLGTPIAFSDGVLTRGEPV